MEAARDTILEGASKISYAMIANTPALCCGEGLPQTRGLVHGFSGLRGKPLQLGLAGAQHITEGNCFSCSCEGVGSRSVQLDRELSRLARARRTIRS